MAKIVSFSCPHCGAALSVDADDRDVTCRFCQVTSVIQRAPAPQPPRPPWPVPQVTVSAAQVEAHVRKRNVLLAVWIAGPMVLLLGVTAMGALLSRSDRSTDATDPPSAAAQAAADEPKADKRAARSFASPLGVAFPLIVDANGDGTRDLLVASGATALTAFDGKSGAELWTTPLGGGFRPVVFVSENRVIVANDVQAEIHDVATGAVRATATLDDKVDRACAPAGGKTRLRLRDGALVAIDLATGKVTAEPKNAPCADARTTAGPDDDVGRRHFAVKHLDPALGAIRCGSVQVSGTWNYLRADPCGPTLRMNAEAIGELEPDVLVPFEGGHLILGAKRRGRKAAMLGYAKGGKLVWSSTLSKAEPAALPERPAERAALHGHLVAASYPETSGERLAVVDVRTGQRVLDVALREPLVSISSLGDGRFALLSASRVDVLDAAGKVRTLVD